MISNMLRRNADCYSGNCRGKREGSQEADFPDVEAEKKNSNLCRHWQTILTLFLLGIIVVIGLLMTFQFGAIMSGGGEDEENSQ